jgi:hypothetical protein
MFIKELRKRVDHYFRITVRTLRVIILSYNFSKLFLKILVLSWFVNLKNKCNIHYTTNY